MNKLNITNSDVKRSIALLSPILHGKDESVAKILTCIFSGGHALLEDLPGLGKTTVAIAVSKLLGLTFARVQCTNDLLPTDITGLNIFKPERGEFEFRAGPIFNNLVLVDEINRATPKTQSALLEAMGEEQTTVDGTTYSLPKPFFVVATQNPVEHSGTFPLPESQIDRFMMRISIGYPPREAEHSILKLGSQKNDIDGLLSIFTASEILDIQGNIERNVTVSEKIFDYVISLAERSRNASEIEVGISTRGAMMLLRTAKTVAWMHSRDYVLPEDVKAMAREVLLHRIQFRATAASSKHEILNSIFMGTSIFG